MSQLICDTVNTDEEDEFDDRAIPRAQAWTATDQLTPEPPDGWLHVVSLPKTPDGLSVGAWICGLQHVQWHEVEAKCPGHHMIARDWREERCLLVHPDLATFASQLVEDINGIMTTCTCGGADCLAGPLQWKALKVLGRRVWNRLSDAKRLAAAADYRDYGGEAHFSLAIVLAPLDLETADSPFNISFLEQITGARDYW
jgi:hypothetical protein